MNYLYEKYKIKPNIVYGGGVKEENIKEILNIPKLGGIMLGKTSSDINKVVEIVKELK